MSSRAAVVVGGAGAIAVAACVAMALGGCSGGGGGGSSAGDASGPGDATAAGDGSAADGATADAAVGGDAAVDAGNPGPTTCFSSGDCLGQWCDKRTGTCVQCLFDEQCPDDQVCVARACVEKQACAADADCSGGVCVDGACHECREDGDCGSGRECVAGVCRTAAAPCTEDADCAVHGGVCDPSTGHCADCLTGTECYSTEVCQDGLCVPKQCIAGQSVCLTQQVVQVCRSDGKGGWLEVCEAPLQCLAGECRQVECEPGTHRCEQLALQECDETGHLHVVQCPPGQECVGDSCQPMRQRVLIVFDTSGSMNADPVAEAYPDMCGGNTTERCLQPWPVCESPTDPFTVIGISKKVFGQLFSSEETANVFFALQRFPQKVALSAPVCDGGYYQGDTVVTGDDNAHALSLQTQTWFDQHLDEILLVPFPPPNSSSNLLALQQWVDFKETLFDSGQPCFDHDQCDGGVCLGTAVSKTCHVFTNPELRAHGWTPLGKSLFYAGEYLRKYVVVDGKPCQTDADCGSVGYFCDNTTKRCFDPLRGCRPTIVVLFTDGGETEFPFTTEFFNPVVQAKRLRVGLGCETDDDCSALPYCRPKLSELECSSDDNCPGDQVCNVVLGKCEDPTKPECFPNYCKQGADGNYCTNDAIEALAAPPVTFTDKALHADVLRDYNGNPIHVVVNVVDASLTAPDAGQAVLTNNFQIALHGGGLYVPVSVEDEADFLHKLKTSIDPKLLYQQCKLAP